MTDEVQLLDRQVEILQALEKRFAYHFTAGDLARWSAQDVRDAVMLSNQHKLMAMQAIDMKRFDQALNNIETIIYIMSGFVEDLEGEDPSSLN